MNFDISPRMNSSANTSDCAQNTSCSVGITFVPGIVVSLTVLELILITLSNSLTMIILWKYAKLEIPRNIFIACLTLADLVSAMAVPFKLAVWYVPRGLGWTISCVLYLFIQISTTMINISSLFLIGADSLMYILYALRYHTIMTKTRAIQISITFTACSLIFVLVCLSFGYQEVSTGVLATEQCNPNFSILGAIMEVMIIPSLIFVPCTVVCYIIVVLIALKQRREIAAAGQAAAQEPANESDFKIAKITGKVLIVYICCNIMFIMQRLTLDFLKDPYRVILFYMAQFIWRLNRWVNPLIYVWTSKRFRQHISNFLRHSPLPDAAQLF